MQRTPRTLSIIALRYHYGKDFFTVADLLGVCVAAPYLFMGAAANFKQTYENICFMIKSHTCHSSTIKP